ncbi:hypothetical protein, partial [uncultured Aquimarina sp.]|uniref:hypothetical protein n=1 Tax=uncultured Aquimarina sp. TaxID=575652 RepID=UPI0026212866
QIVYLRYRCVNDLINDAKAEFSTTLALIMKKQRIIYFSSILGLILILFFGLGDDIIYAKKGIIRWIPFLIIFLLIPFMISLFLKDFNFEKIKQRGISIGSVLIIGPLFGFWSGYLSNKQLEENGLKTFGIVSEKFKSGKKSGTPGVWLLKCDFNVLNESYKTFSKKDINNQYEIGDTLTIKYSEKNPENNIIIELEN